MGGWVMVLLIRNPWREFGYELHNCPIALSPLFGIENAKDSQPEGEGLLQISITPALRSVLLKGHRRPGYKVRM